MKKRANNLLIGSLLALACTGTGLHTSILAATASTTAPVEVSKTLQSLVGAPIQQVRKSAFGDLFEVITEQGIAYTNKEQTFVIFNGVAIDVATKRNLTQDRLNQLGAFKFSDLPLNDAIKTVRGDGSRVVVTWEDPNCGYCKKMRKTLDELSNVTVYTFPVGILSEDSVKKAKAIWCSHEKEKVWYEWMANNVSVPAAADCENPVMRNNALLKKYRINGTPALFFRSGERISGYVAADRIEAELIK